MATARDWITRALKRNGVLGLGESLSAEDAAASLDELNDMLASWTLEPSIITEIYSDGFTLTPTVTAYSSSLMANGRPVGVKAGKVSLSGTNYPLNINIDSADFDTITRPSTPGIPKWCWINEGVTNTTFNFYPAPYAAFAATFQCWGPLAGGVLTLDTVVQVAPGYPKAIVDGLAVELCATYQKEPTSVLLQRATEAKAWVKRHNHRPREVESLGLPAGVQRRIYNIYGDN